MIVIIDYGMGNLTSVKKALNAVSDRNIKISSNPDDLYSANALVLPGVGNFGDGMKNLRRLGLEKAITENISNKKPFLGICLGMQLLLESSEEAPDIPGLSVFKGNVVKFPPEINLKIPHIGWNNVCLKKRNLYFNNIKSGTFYYFVHSYYPKPCNSNIIAGETEYGIKFCSCIADDNILATQFHPEKSQKPGLTLLKNFLNNIEKSY